jgi:hypothetical protein
MASHRRRARYRLGDQDGCPGSCLARGAARRQASVDRTWKLTNNEGKPIQVQVQVASGTDGRLHLFLTGFEDRPGAPDLAHR